MKTSSINNKMSTVRQEMNPNEYSDRKVSEITLDAIIIHYTNINLDNIPDYAKEKIALAINPQVLHTKY
jgi:hypothetical protein